MILIHVLTFFSLCYVLLRGIYPLPWARGKRVAMGILLCMMGLKLQATQVLAWFSLELPYSMQIIWGWAHGTFVFFTILLFVRDTLLALRCILTMLFCKKHRQARDSQHTLPRPAVCAAANRFLCHWLIVAACIACAGSVWGLWQACRVPEVRTLHMRLPDLPEAPPKLRIVQLSDVHASSLLQRQWVEAVVEKVNALQPDLIVLTGDIVDGLPEVRAQDVAPLAELRARYGVWACLGNHEYYSDVQAWQHALPKLGIQVLDNRHVVLDVEGGKLVLAGVTDRVASRWKDSVLPMPDAQQALHTMPQNVFCLMLAHRPTEAPLSARAGAHMQLSGHTHGGQIWGLTALVRVLNEGLLCGVYNVGDMQVYVSPGTGISSFFPLRIGVSSEITEILLHKAQ